MHIEKERLLTSGSPRARALTNASLMARKPVVV
jgi:hypothetical protein